MISSKPNLESLTVASTGDINSLKQNTKENSMQKVNATQDSCTKKEVAAAKLPVIKIKSINLLRNDNLIQKAKVIQERNSKEKLALQILTNKTSDLYENKRTLTPLKNCIVLTNFSPEKKVTLYNFNQTSLKTGPDIAKKKESPTLLSPKLQNQITESIPNKSLIAQGEETKQEGEKEATTSFKKTTEHTKNTSFIPPKTQKEKKYNSSIVFSYEPLRPIYKSYCRNHGDLVNSTLLHEDLVRPGDTFTSVKDIFSYTNARGNEWKFYFKILTSDNRKMKHRLKSVTMTCCFKKNANSSTYQPKGIRKRRNYKTDCPCTIILHQLANNHFKAIHVCYHHDHELSSEMLAKLPARYKVACSLHFKDFKEEVLDLASIDVDAPTIHKYMENKTGQKINYYSISNYVMALKKDTNRPPRQFTAEKLKSLLIKAKELHELYGPKQNTDDNQQLTTSQSGINSEEPFNLCKELIEIRKRKRAKEILALENSKKPKRIRNRKKRPPPLAEEQRSDIEIQSKKSRLETTLENMSDDAMLESVNNLQKSNGKETNVDSWPTKCFEEDQLTDVQSSEEFSYPLKVYATTDSSVSKNIYVCSDNTCEMFFEELAIGTEIEVESTDYGNIDQGMEIQDKIEDQTYESTSQEIETRNNATHENEHHQDFKLENDETVQITENIHQLTNLFKIEIVSNESNSYTNNASENIAVKSNKDLSDSNMSHKGSPTHSVEKIDMQIKEEDEISMDFEEGKLPIQDKDSEYQEYETVNIQKSDEKTSLNVFNQDGLNDYKPDENGNDLQESSVSSKVTKSCPLLSRLLEEETKFPTDRLINKYNNSKAKECNDKITNVGHKNKLINYFDQFSKYVSENMANQADETAKSPENIPVVSRQTNNFGSQDPLKRIVQKKCVNKEIQVNMDQLDLKREADEITQSALNIDLNETNTRKEPHGQLCSLMDEIISRHNIDSNINRSEVAEYIQYLSKKTSTSKIDILKNIYSGEAVLIKANNNESSNQETYKLYVYKNVNEPSTPSVPGDNPLCSCSNTCFHLRRMVQSLYDEIDVLKKKLKLNNGTENTLQSNR